MTAFLSLRVFETWGEVVCGVVCPIAALCVYMCVSLKNVVVAARILCVFYVHLYIYINIIIILMCTLPYQLSSTHVSFRHVFFGAHLNTKQSSS